MVLAALLGQVTDTHAAHSIAGSATTTAVTGGSPSSAFAQELTFTATVSAALPGGGTPTGTIQWQVDGIDQWLPVALDADGLATLRTAVLPAGTPTVTAVFRPTKNFLGSAGSLSQTVEPVPTTTTLTTSQPDRSVFGETLTLTATVRPVTPTTAPPSGTLRWLLHGVDQGSPVALDANGQATLTRTSLGPGTHDITAIYATSGNFLGSEADLTQTVVSSDSPTTPSTNPPTTAPTTRPATPRLRPSAGGPVSYAGQRVLVDLDDLFITQFDGSAFEHGNCNMAAGAMLYEVQTGLRVSGADMRRWSGAISLGTSIDDLARAFGSQGQPVRGRSGMPWPDFVRDVAAGRSAVVQGWYGTLPSRYRLQTGFTAGHSVFALAYSPVGFAGTPGFYMLDPLGGDAYQGRWWPSAVLRTYGWSGVASRPRTENHFFGDVALQAHVDVSARPATDGAAARNGRAYWRTVKAAIASATNARAIAAAIPDRGSLGAVLVRADPRLAPGASTQLPTQLGWPVARAHAASRDRLALDLKVRVGSPVVAAADGLVVYRSRRAADGTGTVWLQHRGGFFTAYESLAGIQVATGDWVDAGRALGVVGRATGGSGSAVVTFIVSVGGLPSDPAARVNPRPLMAPR